jgi:hypothetical protein
MKKPFIVSLTWLAALALQAQGQSFGEVRLRLGAVAGTHSPSIPAVVWLQPGPGMPPTPQPQRQYTLLQKNRAFVPHLQVVPVGAVVQFPNADPFFHNVFSMFDGKRFDLGLYEAGTSKAVTFNREGVSYIFCNIHPEMSAVIVALSSPYYSIAAAGGEASINGLPAGDYTLHLWVEGVPQTTLNQWTRSIKMGAGTQDLGTLPLPTPAAAKRHLDKFGNPYPAEPKRTY